MTGEPVLDPTALERLRRIGGDRLLREMIELYLEYGQARVDAIATGAAAGDHHAVEHAAHALKSSAGNLGATRLQQGAERLEQSAARGSVDALLVRETAAEYASSAAALRTVLQSEPA